MIISLWVEVISEEAGRYRHNDSRLVLPVIKLMLLLLCARSYS